MEYRARVFGDDITLDEIHPGSYFSLDTDTLIKGLMEGVQPGFYKTVEDGDMIVAGRYFGMGSGRESGAWAMKLVGIECVIAESLSRYMFRNCVNNGIWPLEVKDILYYVDEGDIIEVYPEEGFLVLNDGKDLRFDTYPQWMVKIIKSGSQSGDPNVR